MKGYPIASFDESFGCYLPPLSLLVPQKKLQRYNPLFMRVPSHFAGRHKTVCNLPKVARRAFIHVGCNFVTSFGGGEGEREITEKRQNARTQQSHSNQRSCGARTLALAG
jgi:hypothetical protein